MTFEQAFTEVVGLEGNYSNDPNDPGNWTGGKKGVGELKGTKFGISAKSYPDLDIANLTLDDAKAIYLRDFWNPLRCSDIAEPIPRILFKQAVNQGVGTCAIRLQKVVGVTPDGVIGVKTIAAVNSGNLKDIAADFLARCVVSYSKDEDWPQYGHGWCVRAFKTAIGAFT